MMKANAFKKFVGAAAVAVVVVMVNCTSESDDFRVEPSRDGKSVVIVGYNGKGGKVVIPGKIQGVPVSEIRGEAIMGLGPDGCQGAFSNSVITSVVVPNSVTKIGPCAFKGSTVSKATIPRNVELGTQGMHELDPRKGHPALESFPIGTEIIRR